MQSFSVIGGTLRWDMAIVCLDIIRIVHSRKVYIVRSGCDGNPPMAILCKSKGGDIADKKIKTTNTTACRHRQLFQEFLLYREKGIKVSGSDCWKPGS